MIEKVIQYQNETYLVSCHKRNYPMVGHTEWEYILCRQTAVTRKRWFRPPVTVLQWVQIDESHEASQPHSLEEFMEEAKNLIDSHYRYLDYKKEREAAAYKFHKDFAQWDGNLS